MLNEYVSLTDRNLLAGPAQVDQLTHTIGKLISYPVTCAPVSNSCISISFCKSSTNGNKSGFSLNLEATSTDPVDGKNENAVVSHSQLTAVFPPTRCGLCQPAQNACY
jgi:hypothetical protein